MEGSSPPHSNAEGENPDQEKNMVKEQVADTSNSNPEAADNIKNAPLQMAIPGDLTPQDIDAFEETVAFVCERAGKEYHARVTAALKMGSSKLGPKPKEPNKTETRLLQVYRMITDPTSHINAIDAHYEDKGREWIPEFRYNIIGDLSGQYTKIHQLLEGQRQFTDVRYFDLNSETFQQTVEVFVSKVHPKLIMLLDRLDIKIPALDKYYKRRNEITARVHWAKELRAGLSKAKTALWRVLNPTLAQIQDMTKTKKRPRDDSVSSAKDLPLKKKTVATTPSVQ